MRGWSGAAPGRAFDVAADMVAQGEHAYLVVGISDTRRTVACRAFGRQDGVPVRPDAVCPVFSVTKPMVAAAVVQLWERGRIALHEPVARYLPGFQANGKEGVLVRHLLTHTSGMNEDGPLAVLRASGSALDLERAVLGTPLGTPPGACQRYNSTAFLALGMLVTAVTGTAVPEYMRREVFEPLGMSSTGFDLDAYGGRTLLVVPNLSELGMGDPIEAFARHRQPAAGLLSTAEDLLCFGREFLRGDRGGRILSPAARTAMMSPQLPGIPPCKPGEYDGTVMGLGWYIPSLPNNKLMAGDGAWHSGAGGCQLLVSPRWGVAVSVIAARIGRRTERILNAALAGVTRP